NRDRDRASTAGKRSPGSLAACDRRISCGCDGVFERLQRAGSRRDQRTTAPVTGPPDQRRLNSPAGSSQEIPSSALADTPSEALIDRADSLFSHPSETVPATATDFVLELLWGSVPLRGTGGPKERLSTSSMAPARASQPSKSAAFL